MIIPSSLLFFLLHLRLRLIFEWQIVVMLKVLPNPLLPLSLHPPGLSGQWVSIRAWPSRRLATSILMLAKTIMTMAVVKMDSRVDPPHCAPLYSRPTGSCHGKQLSLDASWQPGSIASTIGPHPRAFSRQIASSTLKSNLLATIGFYQRKRWFPLFPWTMQRE